MRFIRSYTVKCLTLCVALTLPLRLQADIKSDMASMFNSMGAEANYTEAGSFHGQAGSLYTAGSLSVRAPVSDLQLGAVQLPHISAGCGGIDIFGGSFSFANKEQFIQFTRNLGNNAAGVAFDLALKSLDPMIQDAIGGVRDLVSMVNRQNLNSCEMSKQLVGGAMGMLGTSMSKNCQAAAVESGSADDASDASWTCRLGQNIVREANNARGKNTPQDTISFTGGNITYEALKQTYGNKLSDKEVDWYISLVGTAVFVPPTEDGKDKIQTGIQVFAPLVTDAHYLLNGKYGNETGAEVTVDLWQCRNGKKNMRENCTRVDNQKIPSIRHEIKQHLTKMVQKIAVNAAWTDAEVQEVSKFINNTRLPVLRMAISDAFLGSKNLTKTAIIDAIAIDYLAHILERQERELRTALGFLHKTDEVADDKRQQLFDNLRDLRLKIADDKRNAFAKIEVEQNFMNAMAQFDTQWRSNFTGMSDSLLFDQNNRL